MSKIDFTFIEDASRGLRYAVHKYNENFSLEATCASGKKDTYFRFVVLTQRIVRDGKVVGYVCYRSKRPDITVPVVFSSYEIFNKDFDIGNSTKIHVQPDPEDAFKQTFDAVLKVLH